MHEKDRTMCGTLSHQLLPAATFVGAKCTCTLSAQGRTEPWVLLGEVVISTQSPGQLYFAPT